MSRLKEGRESVWAFGLRSVAAYSPFSTGCLESSCLVAWFLEPRLERARWRSDQQGGSHLGSAIIIRTTVNFNKRESNK